MIQNNENIRNSLGDLRFCFNLIFMHIDLVTELFLFTLYWLKGVRFVLRLFHVLMTEVGEMEGKFMRAAVHNQN